VAPVSVPSDTGGDRARTRRCARYYREGGLYDWRDRLHDDVPDE